MVIFELYNGFLLVLLAGAVGSIVPPALKEGMTRKRRITYLVVGVFTALCLVPGAVSWGADKWHLKLEVRIALGFVFGTVALPIAMLVSNFIERKGAQIMEAVFDKFFSRSGGDK